MEKVLKRRTRLKTRFRTRFGRRLGRRFEHDLEHDLEHDWGASGCVFKCFSKILHDVIGTSGGHKRERFVDEVAFGVLVLDIITN